MEASFLKKLFTFFLHNSKMGAKLLYLIHIHHQNAHTQPEKTKLTPGRIDLTKLPPKRLEDGQQVLDALNAKK